MKFLFPLTASLLAWGADPNAFVLTANGRIALAPNPALVTFVATSATTAESALKDATLSSAKDQAVTAAMGHIPIPIPIIGPYAPQITKAVLGKFMQKPVLGFSVGFVKGLSASNGLPSGEVSFQAPVASVEGGTLVLLRVKPSVKDATRVVRSLRVSVKVSGPTVTPDAQNTTVLAAAEDIVASRQEVLDGNIVLIPEEPLEKGEYALAVAPVAKNAMVPVTQVWDFRVGPAAAPPPAAESPTIKLGMSPAQVTAILGSPARSVKLANKEMYFYKDFKVVFVDGKVSEIQ